MLRLTKILQLIPNEHVIEQLKLLQTKLPNEAKHLSQEALHITLWKTSKDDIKALSTTNFSMFNNINIETDTSIFVIERQAVIVDGVQKIPLKQAWITLLPESVQTELRHVAGCIAKSVGRELSQYEQQRPFHISLGNLTGSPFDSVGDVSWSDIQK